MAVVEKVIAAPPEKIFAVLADGWSYSDWVVGTAHIRDVDDGWPAPGSEIHHQAAIWPVAVRDRTVVQSSDPPRELRMRARLRPFGELNIVVTLEPLTEQQTKVTMTEDVAAGPLRWTHNKINDLLLHRRNVEALRRLADIAVHKG
jgi:uncharacterized protein YndB with AHSA1/START domain